MGKPSPYQIMAFAQAARERSFSQAASILGVTQSSVTQHVANLEHTMGAQLFIRRRDGLKLTRAGRELFDVADRWAAINDLVHERIADYSALEDGHLRITATAPRPALPLIAEFNRQHPKILIDFTLKNWTQNTAAIRDREVDIAVFTDPALDDSVFAQWVEDVRYHVFVRGDHPFAGRTRVSLSELQEETIILTEDGSLTQKTFFETSRKHGLPFRKIVKMTTFAVVKEAILHGLGIGLLLENSIHETQRLVSFPIDEIDRTFRNYVVVPREKEKLRPIRQFLSLV